MRVLKSIKRNFIKYRFALEKGQKVITSNSKYFLTVNKEGIYSIWVLCGLYLCEIGTYLDIGRAKLVYKVIIKGV